MRLPPSTLGAGRAARSARRSARTLLRVTQAAAAAIAFTTAPVGSGATYHAGPADYLAVLKRLRAGDTLALAPGDYARGLPVHGLVGEQGKPIVITGPAAQGVRFLARRGAHTVSIVNSAWVEIRNLELEGNGLPVAAVRAEGHADWAHHITLDRLTIRGHGSGQQTVGI